MNAKKAEVATSRPTARVGAKRSLKSTRADDRSRADSKVDSHLAELQTLWQEELEVLRTQRFTSVEEAVDAIITQVAKRMGSDEDTVEFLRLLCATDPSMQEAVRNTLKISR